MLHLRTTRRARVRIGGAAVASGAFAAFLACTGADPRVVPLSDAPAEGGAADAPNRDSASELPPLIPPTCRFTDAAVAFCDDFDDEGKPPLWRWQAPVYTDQNGGVEQGEFAPFSPPRALRIALDQRADAGRHGAVLPRSIVTAGQRFDTAFDYRVDDFTLASNATRGTASIASVQGVTAEGVSMFNVQLEGARVREAGATRLEARVYVGSELLQTLALPDVELVTGSGQRLRVGVVVEADAIRITIARDGELLADATPVAIPVATTPARWNLSLGGFSGGIPLQVRPRVVHIFDNVEASVE